MASLPSGSAQFGQLATFRGLKTALWPHALSVHEVPTKATLAHSVIRLIERVECDKEREHIDVLF